MFGRMRYICLVALLTAGCAGAGVESFTIARQLEQQNRLEDSLPMYEDALAKEPDNATYQAAITSIRSRLSHQALESAKEQLATTPTQFDNLRNAQGFLDKALKIDSGNTEARTLASSVKEQMDQMQKKAETAYDSASKALEARKWLDALNLFKGIRLYYPGYLDLGARIAATENSALSYFLKEADKNKADDDVDAMIKNLESALEIQPGNKLVADALKDARLKNNAMTNIDKAERSAGENQWDRVRLYLNRAQKLNPTVEETDRIKKLYADGNVRLIAKVSAETDKKMIYSAFSDLSFLADFNPDAFNSPGVNELKSKLTADIIAKAEELETGGYVGLALYWIECANRISESQKDLYPKIQALKDRVRQRVIKKIAVMDFTPPANNPDAAKLVTDSLLSYMTRNASGDVKILARDVLGALIKEIEMGQAGLYDIETAKKSGKLKGTDVFIFGSLLQYSVENSVDEGQKMVIAKVGVDKIPNPQYTTWMSSHPSPSDEEMLKAPPAIIEKDKTEAIRYKVATHHKTANVVISFRVIDVESGEVVITKTLKSKKEATGNYSEGVDIAGIPYQKPDLPQDSDLLEKAVDEAIAELGHQVFSRFQNLQETYFNTAELLVKKGDNDAAAEKYMDAIVTEEIKNINSQISGNSLHGLDLMLKQTENYHL